jgi:hypothetical protein
LAEPDDSVRDCEVVVGGVRDAELADGRRWRCQLADEIRVRIPA